ISVRQTGQGCDIRWFVPPEDPGTPGARQQRAGRYGNRYRAKASARLVLRLLLRFLLGLFLGRLLLILGPFGGLSRRLCLVSRLVDGRLMFGLPNLGQRLGDRQYFFRKRLELGKAG